MFREVVGHVPKGQGFNVAIGEIKDELELFEAYFGELDTATLTPEEYNRAYQLGNFVFTTLFIRGRVAVSAEGIFDSMPVSRSGKIDVVGAREDFAEMAARILSSPSVASVPIMATRKTRAAPSVVALQPDNIPIAAKQTVPPQRLTATQSHSDKDADWWLRAACKGVPDPEIFYSEAKGKQDEALGYCRRCLVLAQCLGDALKEDLQ